MAKNAACLLTGLGVGVALVAGLATGPAPRAATPVEPVTALRPIAERGVPVLHAITIMPAAFRDASNQTNSAVGACGIVGFAPNFSFEAIAPVQLPHGATIVGFQVIANDDYPPGSLNVRLRASTDTCGTAILSSLTTAALSGSFLDLQDNGLSHVVDTFTEGYDISAQWSFNAASEILVVRVRILYTLPEIPLPMACAGDNNGDSMVDAADLSVLLAQFGHSCTP